MEIDLIVFLVSLVICWYFFSNWCFGIFKAWRPRPNQALKAMGCLLPQAALAAMLYTLTTIASFDVVESGFYIFFYVVLGYAFICVSLGLMHLTLDLSWKQDLIHLANPAALAAFSGGYLGLTAIYCGANIGDGPAWWCVLFAGGLGLLAWLALGRVLARWGRTFERITIDRDVSCGLRTGAYLLASGLILGRASAGDWSGFEATMVEFLDGWPVLILTIMALGVDRLTLISDPAEMRQQIYHEEGFPAGALFWAAIYLILALTLLYLMPPLTENPGYAALGLQRLSG